VEDAMRIISVVVLSISVVAVGCIHGGRTEAGASASAQAAEVDLAAALAGRTAGPPQRCVNEVALAGGRSYGRDAILFGVPTDDVVYVNRPPAGCPELSTTRALRTRTPTTQLCRGDIVVVFDPGTGIELGSCSLGEFTSYRRIR